MVVISQIRESPGNHVAVGVPVLRVSIEMEAVSSKSSTEKVGISIETRSNCSHRLAEARSEYPG